MIVLLAPDGGRVYIPESESHMVPTYLATGHVQLKPAQVAEETPALPKMQPEPLAIDIENMTVAQVRKWLATEPPGWQVEREYAKEADGKHRKGALDAMQDYIGNGES